MTAMKRTNKGAERTRRNQINETLLFILATVSVQTSSGAGHRGLSGCGGGRRRGGSDEGLELMAMDVGGGAGGA